jgi:hypothetical protein
MTTQQTQPTQKDNKATTPVPGNGAKDAKAADPKAADPKAADPKAATPPAGAAADAAKAERISKKVYIVEGAVHEFANAREAEKFLNTDPAAPATYKAIKGNLQEPKKKISLR